MFVGYIFVTREEMWGEVLKYFVSVGYIFVTCEVMAVRVCAVSSDIHCLRVTFL